MIIVASKLFESDFSQSILHMLHPSLPHLRLLFDENPDLEHVLVTDCVEPLYQADLKRIESERKFKTHIQRAFLVQRNAIDGLSSASQKGLSWIELLGPFADA
jgi:hypothetical protein